MGTPASPNSPCVICCKLEAVMHSHHTVPRSRGGEESLQISLCPTCHNSLHAHALFLVSQINKNKIRKPKQFWVTAEHEARAQQFLEILVRAILSPVLASADRQHLLSASVGTSTFENVKLLQMDLGMSSMEKTLAYCINFVLHSKGLSNVSRKSKKESSMWFMH